MNSESIVVDPALDFLEKGAEDGLGVAPEDDLFLRKRIDK